MAVSNMTSSQVLIILNEVERVLCSLQSSVEMKAAQNDFANNQDISVSDIAQARCKSENRG